MQIWKMIEQHPDIAKCNGAIADSVYPELEGKSGKRRSMGLHWSKPRSLRLGPPLSMAW